MATNSMRAVSLFSNCGAGDVGYAKAGFKFAVMAEIDQRRLDVCLLNHPSAVGVPGDLRDTWSKVVSKYRKIAGSEEPALVAACPPCQGMSTARSGRGKQDDADAGSKDSRNLLVTVIVNVVKKLRPKIVVVENVPAFLSRKIRHPSSGLPVTAASFLIESLGANYAVYPVLADLCDFGVPQTRRRTFLTLVRNDLPCAKLLKKQNATPYPIPHYAPDRNGKSITVSEALEKRRLPTLDAKNEADATSTTAGGLHFVPIWNDRRYEIISAIPPNTGRSAWQNMTCSKCGGSETDEEAIVCSQCRILLPRPIVAENHEYRLIRGFRSSSYSRMKPDQPAATITTASGHLGSDHTIHHSQNRVMSPLECAILQTFPATFKWGRALKKWGHTTVREMIGEAVPPLFTRKHGSVLYSLLKDRKSRSLLPASDQRVKRAFQKLGNGE